MAFVKGIRMSSRQKGIVKGHDGIFKKLSPIVTIVAALVVVWYGFTVYLNSPWQIDLYKKADVEWTMSDLVRDTMAHNRPILPAPHQIIVEIWETTVNKKITSKRSLIFHAGITLSSTLLGFVIGTILGIGLAVAIVENRAMDKSLMPWIITSQTIPILAIAPMIIVVLNAVGVSGLLPKALISTYLSFFPVAVGMVKGLRSPDLMLIDLMRTYKTSRIQLFWKLRLPSSVPFLFASMKVAIATSLVGAIVGELPTGAVAGLGARLLAGSYYGQTIQIWSALITAAAMAAALVTIVGIVSRVTLRRMGFGS
jgi:NitT/TauT family transport system permease protein